jgi:hypothetical protein
MLAAAAAFVGCGGGAHSGLPNAAGSHTPAMSSAVFRLSIPLHRAPASTARKPLYISPNTQSISITVGPQGGPAGTPVIADLTTSDPSCTQVNDTLTCAIAAAAPVGTDTFTIALYSGQGATGSVLSSATVNGTVVAGQANSIPLTLNGTVASISLSITNGNNVVPGGFATTLPVIITALDASGATIVGPGNYANPITLTNADTSGVTTLSATTVNSPSDVVTFAYNPTDANSGVLNINSLPVGATTISASAGGATGAQATFQYVADRFFGLNHARTFGGTANVTITTYNGSATPSPNPSAWSYTISGTLTVHGNATAQSITGLLDSTEQFSYAQTSPATSAPAETIVRDVYRGGQIGGFNLYRYLQSEVDVNGGTIASPITGFPVGTTTSVITYPTTSPLWYEDVLPHQTTQWGNTGTPFSEVWTGAQVATGAWNADGTTTYSQTVPSISTQALHDDGSAVNYNGTTGVTTSIGAPSGGNIPIAQETTSPAPGPTNNYTVPNWYTTYVAAYTLPLLSESSNEAYGAIDPSCNVPGNVATSAWAIVRTQRWLRPPVFQFREITQTDYFATGGIGFVCETYLETDWNYRFGTGVLSSRKIITYVYGVQNAGALGIRRR